MVLRADEQARGTRLRYALVKLFYQIPQYGAPLLRGDAVGFVDGKHYRFSLVYGHLHERQVLLSNNALQAHAPIRTLHAATPQSQAI